MPHCEEFLYDAVLAANVADAGLQHVCILGNSFTEYAARLSLRPAREALKSTSLLLRLHAHVQGAHTRGPRLQRER